MRGIGAVALGSVTLSAAVLGASLAGTAAEAEPTAAGAPSTPGDHGEHCTPLAVDRITYRTAEGVNTGSDNNGAEARVYHYHFAPGDDIEQVVPPAGFDPATASDEELKAFEWAPRPTDPEQRAVWQSRANAHRGYSAPGLCVYPDSVGGRGGGTQYHSDNWSGGEDIQYKDYRRAYATWVQPVFNYCANSSATVVWPGLGGDPLYPVYGNGALIQGGTSTQLGGSGDANSFFPWWEAIGPGGTVDTSMTAFNTSNWFASAGDTLYASVNYNASYGSTGRVEIDISDYNSGYSVPPLRATTILGHPASYFYDGSSAEFIVERPKNLSTGKYWDLRDYRPTGLNFSNATVFRADGSYNGISIWPHKGNDMYSNPNDPADPTYGSGTSAHALSLMSSTNPFPFAYGFPVYWKSCR